LPATIVIEDEPLNAEQQEDDGEPKPMDLGDEHLEDNNFGHDHEEHNELMAKLADAAVQVSEHNESEHNEKPVESEPPVAGKGPMPSMQGKKEPRPGAGKAPLGVTVNESDSDNEDGSVHTDNEEDNGDNNSGSANEEQEQYQTPKKVNKRKLFSEHEEEDKPSWRQQLHKDNTEQRNSNDNESDSSDQPLITKVVQPKKSKADAAPKKAVRPKDSAAAKRMKNAAAQALGELVGLHRTLDNPEVKLAYNNYRSAVVNLEYIQNATVRIKTAVAAAKGMFNEGCNKEEVKEMLANMVESGLLPQELRVMALNKAITDRNKDLKSKRTRRANGTDTKTKRANKTDVPKLK
jgi:hypothetical protein